MQIPTALSSSGKSYLSGAVFLLLSVTTGLAPNLVLGEGSSTAEDKARVDQAVAELEASIETMDYQAALYHPLHFPPAIHNADNRECLVCHKEIIERKPLAKSPAGVEAASVLAWYQTLDTYEGEQMTFHQRHLSSDFAKSVMNLSCNFCHHGNDPREEDPVMMDLEATVDHTSPPFTLRKLINPTETCLLCHGAMSDPVGIMALPGPWPEVQKYFEAAEGTNGCLVCHASTFRTERHQVSYLNAEGIEKAAEGNSDVCYGCHGGRAWYSIAYPYARNSWPSMGEQVPDWAKDRPVHSDPRYALTKP